MHPLSTHWQDRPVTKCGPHARPSCGRAVVELHWQLSNVGSPQVKAVEHGGVNTRRDVLALIHLTALKGGANGLILYEQTQVTLEIVFSDATP